MTTNYVKALGDIGPPVAYYPAIARVVGGASAGIMICQLLYWTGRQADPEGWIYKTQAQMEQETALTRYEQEGARKQLVKAGVLETQLRGIPATTHYRIKVDALNDLLQSSLGKTSNQVWGKPANLIGENHQTNTETTQETTTDTLDGSPTGERARLFEQVATVCYGGWSSITPTERTRVNVVVKELMSIGATAEQVATWKKGFDKWRSTQRQDGEFPLTPQTITKMWSKFARSPTTSPTPASSTENDDSAFWNVLVGDRT